MDFVLKMKEQGSSFLLVGWFEKGRGHCFLFVRRPMCILVLESCAIHWWLNFVVYQGEMQMQSQFVAVKLGLNTRLTDDCTFIMRRWGGATRNSRLLFSILLSHFGWCLTCISFWKLMCWRPFGCLLGHHVLGIFEVQNLDSILVCQWRKGKETDCCCFLVYASILWLCF
jgi:hypothetical protein